MRERWFGAHGFKVPEIAVEGADVELVDAEHVAVAGASYEALVLAGVEDAELLRRAHDRGTAVVVRAATPEQVQAALARPEVACAAVPVEAAGLRELDLTGLTYE